VQEDLRTIFDGTTLDGTIFNGNDLDDLEDDDDDVEEQEDLLFIFDGDEM